MDTLLLLVYVATPGAAGYALALYRLRRERQRLSELRRMVAGEMEAMYQVHRIHDAFLEARDALRRRRPMQLPSDRRDGRTR